MPNNIGRVGEMRVSNRVKSLFLDVATITNLAIAFRTSQRLGSRFASFARHIRAILSEPIDYCYRATMPWNCKLPTQRSGMRFLTMSSQLSFLHQPKT